RARWQGSCFLRRTTPTPTARFEVRTGHGIAELTSSRDTPPARQIQEVGRKDSSEAKRFVDHATRPRSTSSINPASSTTSARCGPCRPAPAEPRHGRVGLPAATLHDCHRADGYRRHRPELSILYQLVDKHGRPSSNAS